MTTDSRSAVGMPSYAKATEGKTAEERASYFCSAYRVAYCDAEQSLAKIIRAAEQAAAERARAEEREACAKLAEQTDFDSGKFADWNRQIAAAIRERAAKGEG